MLKPEILKNNVVMMMYGSVEIKKYGELEE